MGFLMFKDVTTVRDYLHCESECLICSLQVRNKFPNARFVWQIGHDVRRIIMDHHQSDAHHQPCANYGWNTPELRPTLHGWIICDAPWPGVFGLTVICPEPNM